jgi:hypothetical protein
LEIERALEWLQTTPVAITIAENDVLFPWIESVHVLAIVIVVGTISIVARRLMNDIIPYTWGAFAVAAISGALMFSSDATHYAHNRLFQTKLVMLVLAGLNMATFHFFGVRDIERWEAPGAATPTVAKAAAGISLLVWITVVSLGRGTGFTMH